MPRREAAGGPAFLSFLIISNFCPFCKGNSINRFQTVKTGGCGGVLCNGHQNSGTNPAFFHLIKGLAHPFSFGTGQAGRLAENAGAAEIALAADEVRALDDAPECMEMPPAFGGTPAVGR